MDVFSIMNRGGEIMKDLNGLSWADIGQIGDSGHAREIFALGATKKDNMKDGYVAEWRIIGFDHDDLAEGFGKAPISWELVYAYKENRPMNSVNTNKGGWDTCELNAWLNTEFFSRCSDELQAIIKPVFKLTSAGECSREIIKSKNKIWIKSEKELYGRCFYSVPGEGHWYEMYQQEDVPYYKEDGRGNRVYQSPRSPRCSSYGSGFCGTGTDGTADIGTAMTFRALLPGFCS